MNIRNLIKEKTLVFDGAMGTNIMKRHLGEDDFQGYANCNEFLVVSRPDVISDIHSDFFKAGCDIAETDTFGASPLTLKEYGLEKRAFELNKKAAMLAKEVANSFSNSSTFKFVSGSMGPGAKLPSLGQISFEELEKSYMVQAEGLIEGGVDLIQVETAQDLLQIKAAIAGIENAKRKYNKNVPIVVQVTIEKTGKMLLGTDIYSVISTFSSFDLFALGMNCGTGPDAMHESVRIFSKNSPFYISVLPNAGLPKLIDGNLVYDMDAETYSTHVADFVKKSNAELVGGCCGTTPEFLKKVVEKVSQIPVKRRKLKDFSPSFSSLYKFQESEVFPKPLIIGERANANGSKKFRERLLDNDYEGMLEIALKQQKEGAHLIDVCVAYVGRDETKDMEIFIKKLAKNVKTPICIDSTNPKAIKTALENYGGKVLINSINLEEEERTTEIINLAKKFGASLIALTIDENGMAKTKEEKLKIAKKLYDLVVKKHNFKPEELYIDVLTFTLASGDKSLFNAGIETLEAIKLIKKELPGVKTVLGVSNISYGLVPISRKRLNAVFLAKAVEAGLDSAIFHSGKLIPTSRLSKKEIELCENLIFNKRENSKEPLDEIINFFDTKKAEKTEKTEKKLPPQEELFERIVEGKKKGIEKNLEAVLKEKKPQEIINTILLKAMKKVGELFGNGELQLPFVLKSAEVMKTSVAFLEPFLEKSQKETNGSMVIATVKGDVHDIGKNLVDIILSNNGFEVFNIGIDKTATEILESVKKNNPDFIGLSGLLVRSAMEMGNLIEVFNENNIKIPIICGGAALTENFVEKELNQHYKGKVYYADDAFSAISIMSGKEKKTETKETNTKKIANQITKKEINHNFKRPKMPFSGSKILSFDIEELLKEIDKKILFKSRWKFKDEKTAQQNFEKIVKEIKTNNYLSAQAVYGYFKKEETNFEFTRKTPNAQSLDDFLQKEDFLPLFAVSVQENGLNLKQIMEKDEYQKYFLYNGLLMQLAETVAQKTHQKIRNELKIEKNQGKRYSPGYPAWEKLSEQQKIFKHLNPEQIGLNLTETFLLLPEWGVTGVILYHPEAYYF